MRIATYNVWNSEAGMPQREKYIRCPTIPNRGLFFGKSGSKSLSDHYRVAVVEDGSVGAPCGACREYMMQLHKKKESDEVWVKNYQQKQNKL